MQQQRHKTGGRATAKANDVVVAGLMLCCAAADPWETAATFLQQHDPSRWALAAHLQREQRAVVAKAAADTTAGKVILRGSLKDFHLPENRVRNNASDRQTCTRCGNCGGSSCCTCGKLPGYNSNRHIQTVLDQTAAAGAPAANASALCGDAPHSDASVVEKNTAKTNNPLFAAECETNTGFGGWTPSSSCSGSYGGEYSWTCNKSCTRGYDNLKRNSVSHTGAGDGKNIRNSGENRLHYMRGPLSSVAGSHVAAFATGASAAGGTPADSVALSNPQNHKKQDPLLPSEAAAATAAAAPGSHEARRFVGFPSAAAATSRVLCGASEKMQQQQVFNLGRARPGPRERQVLQLPVPVAPAVTSLAATARTAAATSAASVYLQRHHLQQQQEQQQQ
ncbi:hypothetical protein ENH_00082830 [Eimeria necatrix]|uniref:Uncharacterized protein n=1 Tax=Eimeria necatrix TaxID=51315 RepID=U6N299_9EIME|nr:hypothetical protein ENH_00082830 [Eimeria necatrix]CDJ70352.1 hypothetical protein ENH_00082830 [Eimeria necatrix]